MKLLSDKKNLDIKIIKEKLFDNKLEKSLQAKIETELMKLKKNIGNQGALKEILLKELNTAERNYIGKKKSYELIEAALAIIGDVEDVDRGELVLLCKKMINYQLERLSDEGLEWINNNFDNLIRLSKESKIVFSKKLYHKIL